MALLVSSPIAVNLWLLRGEFRILEFANDKAVHSAMIRSAARALRSGHLALDDWFPYLTAGVPQFRQYHSFPHLLIGMPAALIGGDAALQWSTYLLLAFWPAAVYLGARLLDWDRATAGTAALLSPLLVSAPRYGYEYSSYVWGGLGVWAQLCAMVVMPLALGLTWRAIERGRSYAPAALVLGLTLMFHAITGFLAFLALAVWLYVGPSTWARFRRTILVGIAAAAVASWFIVPAAAARAWGATRLPGGGGSPSFGARRVLGWLFSGDLFDHGRFPTVTILVFVGLAVSIARFRTDARARAMFVFFALGLLLFFGPAATGDVLRLIPGSGALLFHRFVIAVHMPGLVLAAVGGVFLTTVAVRRAAAARSDLGRITALVAIVVVGMTWLLPAWQERAEYAAKARSFLDVQHRRDRVDRGRRARLIARARDAGGGRIYAGDRTNWGANYRVGYVRGYHSVLNADAEAFGYLFRTGSMLRGVEAAFDEADPFLLDLFNVRYLVLPTSRRPKAPASLLARSGRHTLWSVPSSGYFMVVDTVEPIASDRRRFTRQMIDFVRSPTAHARLFPTVGFGDTPAAKPTATRARPPGGRPGSVVATRDAPTQGRFRAVVRTNRPAALLLKASFVPSWTATVDGAKVKPYLVAPGFPAVTVAPGEHTIEFEYRPYPLYPLLFTLSGVVMIGLIWVDRARRSLPPLPPPDA